MAPQKDSRLRIKRRSEGERSTASPRTGNREQQFKNAGERSLQRYRSAYEELAKV
ncbi:hypothetical protein [Kushneria aurantia]|uniref:Uncharacterized protein n=1 Tax=Kushneria aurantia TaxID=504092 RepID=A0ABV6G4P0_9GAMM|nr:hypothetical protein [Kushneria aurantia]